MILAFIILNWLDWWRWLWPAYEYVILGPEGHP